MSALSAHRSLGGRLRFELYRNVCLLSLRRPMLQELYLMLNGGPQTLDKLNQALIVHLSYYLASIIEPKMAQLISWPLYDKSSERTFKTQLLSFVSMYYNKDGSAQKDKWITPIQPSYLNAGGFKVMQLLFEMSQLALSKLIRNTFSMTEEKLEACDLSKFIRQREKLNTAVVKAKKQFTDKAMKFSMYKKKAAVLSESYKESISYLEKENEELTKTLHRSVDTFSKNDPLGLIKDLKDVNTPSMFLREWSDSCDNFMFQLENEWSAKTQSLINSATHCRQTSKLAVSRSTLNDKSAYTIEYCPKTDKIDTEHLENQVSSQQRYILKNIIKDNKLNFPNLLRGYTVAICFLFKNVRCVEPMDLFNEHLACFGAGYEQLLEKGKWLIDEMHQLELKLQKNAPQSLVEEDFDYTETVIPPLPDLKFRDEPWQHQFTKGFTPLHVSKIQFNIRNHSSVENRQPRSLFQVPVTISRPTLFKNIAKLHANESLSLNVSKISHPAKDLNKTTAECMTGFTQQQLNRLLSSRKSSSKKRIPSKTTDSHSKVRRSNLFKDTPENSFSMVRSLSSPNLNCVSSEMKKKLFQNQRVRQLYAIAQEESPDKPIEISGVVSLLGSEHCTPQKNTSLLEQNADFKSMPTITVSKAESISNQDTAANIFPLDSGISSMVDKLFDQPIVHTDTAVPQAEHTTPVSRNAPTEMKKANSIEKLIEKYKKIRHSTSKADGKFNEFPKLSPITDLQLIDKENDFNEINIDTSFSAQLPDLVSPSCTNISNKTSIVPDWVVLDTPLPKGKKKCRESLGTALGVDKTFLDQFDLIE